MIVGSLSTAIDYGILFALALFGLDSLRGNFISTSIAMIFSFIANKKFTFKDNSSAGKMQIAKFFVITTFGLWVIQPIIIEGFKYLASPIIPNAFIVLFVGKTLATIASMIWNFVLYKKFVFTTPL